jgi:hypothetical protein
MAHDKASAACSTLLSTLGGTYPIQYENKSFNPPAGLYLAESTIPAGNGLAALSQDGSEVMEGIFQVLCYAAKGEGKGGGIKASGTVAALFQRGLRLSLSGVTVTVRKTEQGPAFTSGDRYAWPVSVYYRLAV